MTVKIDTDAEINSVRLKEVSPPAAPASGYGQLYANSGDSKAYYKNDAGIPYDITYTGTSFSGAVLTKSTTQSIVINTGTAVSFDGEVFDTDGYHDNVTNNTRLTAPVTGYYHAGGSVEINSLVDQKNYIVIIRKNGAAEDGDGRFRIFASGGSAHGGFFSRIVQLNAGEYVELIVTQGDTATRDARETTNGTSFWIYKIG